MRRGRWAISAAAMLLAGGPAGAAAGWLAASPLATDPIVPGWSADPKIRCFGDRYRIYPTTSVDLANTVPALSPAQASAPPA